MKVIRCAYALLEMDANCRALTLLPSPFQICMGLYYIIIHVSKREEYRHVQSVGYSCVLFGWMTILAVRQPGM